MRHAARDGQGRISPRPGTSGPLVVTAAAVGSRAAAGRLDPDLGSPGDLACALIAPVALARVRWLHTGARPEEIGAARELASRHAAPFIRAVFR